MYPILARHCRAGALVMALGFASFPLLGAAPPANDNCNGAFVVPPAGPFPYLSPVADALLASKLGDPPLASDCGPTNVSRSVWYKFVPAQTAPYTFSVGTNTATIFGSEDNTDTLMALYSAPSCAGPFNFLDCNDDSGLLHSSLLSTLTAGVSYYVVVWVGEATTVSGQPMPVQLRVERPFAPSNDTCATAEVIPASGPFPHLTSIQDTTLATVVGDPPNAACASFHSLWYKFTPAVAGTYTFSSDTDTGTSIFDTVMGLFTNPSSCGGTFTQVECVDDFGSRPRASITRALVANTTVYIVVWDYLDIQNYTGETSLQLRVSLAGPPTVVTTPATSLTTTGVVLNMSINPNNFSTRWFFEWGTTTNYGTMTPSRLMSIPPLTLMQPRSELIGGISPSLTYHYRAVGSNSQGKVFGLDQSFLVTTNRPVITSLSRQPGGQFLLRFNASPGQLYVVQGSADLQDWLIVGDARELGGGVFEFLHSPGPSPPYRFYEVRVR